MADPKPTRAQRDALVLLAKGNAYRSTRAFSNDSVHADGGHIPPATVKALVRNRWAMWGPEVSLRKLRFPSGRQPKR